MAAVNVATPKKPGLRYSARVQFVYDSPCESDHERLFNPQETR
jgi:hypothetical protein